MALGMGAVFAGYRVLRPLGSGGMGDVYLVQHPRLPRNEALKVLHTDVSADESFRQRFIREADLAAGLSHPNIVTVYDRGEFDDQLWIATEYVDGTDAAQLLRSRYPAGMPLDEATAIVTAIASALDYAHEKGLLHRDVKPANILLSNPGSDGQRRVFLADFGIARPLADPNGLTATNLTVGTVAYAAPEQLLGEDIDGQADQYALAATAFHLLTGVPVFEESNPVAVIGKHLATPAPPISRRRPDLAHLDAVFAAALAKNPSERYTNCSAFAKAISAQAIGGRAAGSHAPTEATVAAPSSVTENREGSKSTRRTVVMVGVAAAALGALSMVVLNSRTNDTSEARQSTASSGGLIEATNGVTTTTPTPYTSLSSVAKAPSAPMARSNIAGMIVFLDPGHNGDDAQMSQKVPDGRGGTTDCEGPGSYTSNGFKEHTFNWDTVLRVRQALTQLGVRTAMSRGNDDQTGPCVDERAAMANALQPNAIVSIHINTAPASDRGFYVTYSSPPLNSVQGGPSVQFARIMRDQLIAAGLPASAYFGKDGLDPRSDVAGLNLAQYPSIQVDLGNTDNPIDSTLIESASGRQEYADALVKGVVAFLQTQPPRAK